MNKFNFLGTCVGTFFSTICLTIAHKMAFPQFHNYDKNITLKKKTYAMLINASNESSSSNYIETLSGIGWVQT